MNEQIKINDRMFCIFTVSKKKKIGVWYPFVYHCKQSLKRHLHQATPTPIYSVSNLKQFVLIFNETILVLSWLVILDRTYKLKSLDYILDLIMICDNQVPKNNSDK